MKRNLFSSSLFLVATVCAFAASDTITGSSNSATPASFSDPTVWDSLNPTLDKSAQVTLGGADNSTLYYDATGDVVINTLTTGATDSNYVISNSGNGKLTFDLDAANSTPVKIVDFSLGSDASTFTFDTDIDIVSTGVVKGSGAIAQIQMQSNNGTPTTKGIVFNGAVNSYVTTHFMGTIGKYGNGFTINNVFNVYKDETKSAWGETKLNWGANTYQTGGGVRTQIYIGSNGDFNTGTLTMNNRARFFIEDGGKAHVYGNIDFIGDSANEAILNVKKGGTLVVDGDIKNTTVNKLGSITIDGTASAKNVTQGGRTTTNIGGNFTISEKYILNGESDTYKLNINNGGTLKANVELQSGVMNFNNGSKFEGSINQTGGSIGTFGSQATIVFTGNSKLLSLPSVVGNLTVNEGALVEIDNDFIAKSENGTSADITINGEIKVNKVDNYQFRVTGGNVLVASTGKINLADDTTDAYNHGVNISGGTLDIKGMVNSKKILMSAGTLKLNNANAFVKDNMTVCINGEGARIEVNADTSFGDFYLNNGKKVTIAFMDDKSVMSLEQFRSNGTVVSVVFEDFANNRLFSETNNDLSTFNFSGTAYDDTILDSGNFSWVEDIDAGGYWLNYAGLNIPEPAEWAAILGTIALAFAIYRKRR